MELQGECYLPITHLMLLGTQRGGVGGGGQAMGGRGQGDGLISPCAQGGTGLTRTGETQTGLSAAERDLYFSSEMCVVIARVGLLMCALYVPVKCTDTVYCTVNRSLGFFQQY